MVRGAKELLKSSKLLLLLRIGVPGLAPAVMALRIQVGLGYVYASGTTLARFWSLNLKFSKAQGTVTNSES